MSINSPSNLELLLHCHVCGDPHPRADAPAIKAGVDYLVREKMIEPDEIYYRTTMKGKFYIQHILNTPFPETAFSIPERK